MSAGLFGTMAPRLAVPGSGAAGPANVPIAMIWADAGSMSRVPKGGNEDDVGPFAVPRNQAPPGVP